MEKSFEKFAKVNALDLVYDKPIQEPGIVTESDFLEQKIYKLLRTLLPRNSLFWTQHTG